MLIHCEMSNILESRKIQNFNWETQEEETFGEGKMQRGRNEAGPKILLLFAGFLLQNGRLRWTVKGHFIFNKILEISLQPGLEFYMELRNFQLYLIRNF